MSPSSQNPLSGWFEEVVQLHLFEESLDVSESIVGFLYDLHVGFPDILDSDECLDEGDASVGIGSLGGDGIENCFPFGAFNDGMEVIESLSLVETVHELDEISFFLDSIVEDWNDIFEGDLLEEVVQIGCVVVQFLGGSGVAVEEGLDKVGEFLDIGSAVQDDADEVLEFGNVEKVLELGLEVVALCVIDEDLDVLVFAQPLAGWFEEVFQLHLV